MASLNVKIINDVSGASFDENMLRVASKRNFYICLCHSVRTPETMSKNPVYDNVLLDVYDKLEKEELKGHKMQAYLKIIS